MTEEWIAASLAYMKISDPEDVPEALGMIDAALAYFDSINVPRSLANTDALYDMAVRSLALHFYDHRDSVGNEAAFPIGLRPIITKYKITYSI